MYQENRLSLSLVLFYISCVYLYFHTRVLAPYLFILFFLFHTFLFYLYDSYFQGLNYQFEKEREYILKESIETKIYNEEEELCCEICYDDIGTGDSYSKLICNCRGKYYHHECIQTWFVRKNVCPFCRKEFKIL